MKVVLIDASNAYNYYEDFLNFIHEVDHLFEPSLSSRIELNEYAKKLIQEAFIYIIIEDNVIQAACAFYCTPSKFDYAFLSFIASKKKGFGGMLIEKMISKCMELGAKGIDTQTWETNYSSLKLFKRHSFIETDYVNNRNTSESSVLLKLIFDD